jgi:Cdc6-like AAA superfamily ATPase
MSDIFSPFLNRSTATFFKSGDIPFPPYDHTKTYTNIHQTTHQRSGRTRAMDDTGYRQLEKIVKTERRAPLVKITANFNEEKNDSVSKQVGMVYVEFQVR